MFATVFYHRRQQSLDILPLQLSLRPSHNALARALAGMFGKTPTAAKKRHHNFPADDTRLF
jgi:hypothetical protein